MWVQTLTAVALGVAFLHVFFRAVESKWPVSYASLASGPDYAISRNIVRYLAFRLGPVGVTVAYAAVTLRRAHAPVVITGAVIGLIHGLLTSGRAMLELVRRRKVRSRPLVAVMHPTVVILVTTVALVAGAASANLDPVVPAASDVVSSLWIGLIAGVIGSYIGRLTQTSSIDVAEVLTASRRSIPDEVWNSAAAVAADAGADVQLVHAVMLIENIQRPAWFRRLERLAGRLVGHGTYGVLQVASDRPLSEADSLRVAIESRFTETPMLTADDGTIDYEALTAFARGYNPDPKFEELLMQAFSSAGDVA